MDQGDADHHGRRETDQSAAARLTGLTVQQLAVQLIGGLLLAAVVGLSSSWATQQVMGEQLRAMTRQIEELAREQRQMRQDLYAPRYKSSALLEALRAHQRLPPGRP
jgi:hypothetical protein